MCVRDRDGRYEKCICDLVHQTLKSAVRARLGVARELGREVMAAGEHEHGGNMRGDTTGIVRFFSVVAVAKKIYRT